MAAPAADAPPSNRLYAGNLSWRMSDASLYDAFAPLGCTDAKIIMDRDSGRSKGFGFVTFGDESAARAAIESMNGRELEGRAIRLAFASARPEGSGAPREGGRREGGGFREGGFGGGEGRGFGAFGGRRGGGFGGRGGREGGYGGGREGGYGGGREGGYGGGREGGYGGNGGY